MVVILFKSEHQNSILTKNNTCFVWVVSYENQDKNALAIWRKFGRDYSYINCYELDFKIHIKLINKLKITDFNSVSMVRRGNIIWNKHLPSQNDLKTQFIETLKPQSMTEEAIRKRIYTSNRNYRLIKQKLINQTVPKVESMPIKQEIILKLPKTSKINEYYNQILQNQRERRFIASETCQPYVQVKKERNLVYGESKGFQNISITPTVTSFYRSTYKKLKQ